MRRPATAFTLIEILLVLTIITILMAVLIPSVQAVLVAAKNAETRNRIALLVQAIEEYKRVYQGYPLSCSPDRLNSDPADERYYPRYYIPGLIQSEAEKEIHYLFKHDWNLAAPFGGKFLAYFMLGPHGTGWHRPANPNDPSDPNQRTRFISGEFDFPPGLARFLVNAPVSKGDGGNKEFPVFVDAFGLRGFNGGAIGYYSGNLRASGVDRFKPIGDYNHALTEAYYIDTRSHPSWPGDNKGLQHFYKQVANCSADYVVISPGADGKFGYQKFGGVSPISGLGWVKGYWGDMDHGVTDDIANFPMPQ